MRIASTVSRHVFRGSVGKCLDEKGRGTLDAALKHLEEEFRQSEKKCRFPEDLRILEIF
jgi:hypothetical protein